MIGLQSARDFTSQVPEDHAVETYAVSLISITADTMDLR